MSKTTYFLNHPGRQGDFAELRFMARATEMGLNVTKPCSDLSRYDFAVESGGRFSRVQVKSTVRKVGSQYLCCVRVRGTPYSDREIEFVAVYLIPENLWYIIPSPELKRSAQFCITPSRADHKYAQYKEAWWLLKGSPGEMPERSRMAVVAIADKLAEETTGISLIGKNAAAVALGRRGGRKGGKARAKALTPRKRSEMARQAALRRWQAKGDLDKPQDQ